MGIGDSNKMDGRQGWKDGTMNGTGDDLKQIIMRPLDKVSQHQQYKHTRINIPGPLKPLGNNPRQPTKIVPLDE